jgi:hypothetical protein
MFLSIYVFVYQCLCLSMYLSIYVFVYLCFCLSMSLSFYVFVYLWRCLSMSLSIYVFVHLCLCECMSLSIYVFVYLSIYVPIYLHSGATTHWKKRSVLRLVYLFAHFDILSSCPLFSDSFSSLTILTTVAPSVHKCQV